MVLDQNNSLLVGLVSLLLGTVEVVHAGLIGLVGVKVGVIHPLGAEQAQQTVVAGTVQICLGQQTILHSLDDVLGVGVAADDIGTGRDGLGVALRLGEVLHAVDLNGGDAGVGVDITVKAHLVPGQIGDQLLAVSAGHFLGAGHLAPVGLGHGTAIGGNTGVVRHDGRDLVVKGALERGQMILFHRAGVR